MAIKYLQFKAAIIIIFPLILMILSIASTKIRPVSRVLRELRSSLNDYPLADFEYAEECKGKYNGNLFTYGGSREGCSCIDDRDNKTSKELVRPRKCPKNRTRNRCKRIPPTRSQNLEYWINGKFCSRYYNITSKIKGYLYYLNTSVLKNEECQNGYKKCGKLDDMDNYLCVPKDEDCPITDIVVSNTERDDLKDYNYSFIDNKYFYYSNKVDKQIITKLKVVEGKLCNDRTFIHTDYPQYFLDYNFKFYGCRHKIDGELYEKNFEILDTKSKEEFYLYSGLNMSHIYRNPNFEYPFFSLNANMNLYPQRYLGYDKQCLKKTDAFIDKNTIFNEQKIVEVDDYITSVVHINKINMWFCIVALGLSVIISILVMIFHQGFSKIFLIWGAVNLVMFIMILVPIIINLSYIAKFRKIPLCGSPATNTKINFYHSTSNKLKVITIFSFIFDIFYLLFNLAILFCKFFKDKSSGDSSDNSLLNKETNKSSDIDYNKPAEPFSNTD